MRAAVKALLKRSDRFDRRVHRALRHDISIAGRFLPYQPDESSWMVPLSPPEGPPFAVPPPDLWLGYGKTVDAYLASGRTNVDRLKSELAARGKDVSACARILDLGCGAGRMTRWLAELTPSTEVWGADVSAAHIEWCRQHLSPPLRFVNTTSFPHLPFEDHSFDLVYAGSVFTHISDLVDAWLLEIRRILRAGGVAYLTIHDRRTLALLEQNPRRPLGQRLGALPERLRFWKSDFGMFTLKRGFDSLVFYDAAFVERYWTQYFALLAIVPEAYDLQTAVILAKR